MDSLTVSVPLAAPLAVRFTVPPTPLVGDTLIEPLEAKVKLRPALKAAVPPAPETVPPVAKIEKVLSAVISPVAPVVVIETVPPAPVVEPALALSVSPALNDAPLIV